RGLSLDAAKAKLEEAGLEAGTVNEEFSANVPAGKVSSQEPPPGGKVADGSSVALAVSKGPEMVMVPNVVGQAKDAAVQELKQKGLEAEVQEVPDASRTEGTVFSQEPAAGQSVAKGSKVTVSVAVKPQQVKVPNVVNATQAEAQSTLVAAGFQVVVIKEETSAPAKVGRVLSQNPAANAVVEKGGTVTITVGIARPAP
ncbi:MAG: PASTA domain-containing protein, partial [Gemmatimonadetes bacterium]|nr:PASTA domain-containing protein [Gemmatimonadota bacterium]